VDDDRVEVRKGERGQDFPSDNKQPRDALDLPSEEQPATTTGRGMYRHQMAVRSSRCTITPVGNQLEISLRYAQDGKRAG
jgi:hypothetical protein